MSLPSFLGTILTSVVGKLALRLYPRPLRRQETRWWSRFFLGLAKEVCWVEDDCFPLDMSIGAELIDLFFSKSLTSFFAGLFPQGHLESILQVLEDDWSIVFASMLTAFSTAFFQKSRSRPQTSNWARTEDFRSSKNYRIMISLFGVVAESNSWRTACKCFRGAVQLRTSSCWCWESLLSFL